MDQERKKECILRAPGKGKFSFDMKGPYVVTCPGFLNNYLSAGSFMGLKSTAMLRNIQQLEGVLCILSLWCH